MNQEECRIMNFQYSRDVPEPINVTNYHAKVTTLNYQHPAFTTCTCTHLGHKRASLRDRKVPGNR